MAGSKEAKELLVKKIEAMMPKTEFQLNSPRNCTIKTRTGQYKKKSFMGDEFFSLTSSYVGKTGVILVFSTKVASPDFRFMEMSIPDAISYLTGFESYILEVGEFDMKPNETVEEAKENIVMAAEALKKRNLADARFGSW
jgi:hypothetical protein